MNTIVHDSIFDKLAFDLRTTPSDLKELLYEKGVENFFSTIRLKSPYVFSEIHSIDGEFCDSKGSILISNGLNLADKLHMLLERYYNEKKFNTMPLKIKADNSICDYYKFQIKSIILQEIQTALVKNSKLEPLFKNYMINNEDAFSQLENFFNSLTDDIAGINMMLSYVSNFQVQKETFYKTVSSAFLSLIVGRPYFIRSKPISNYIESVNLLLCGSFFQSSYDIPGCNDTVSKSEDAALSGCITETFCDNKETLEAVKLLRAQNGSSPTPLFKEKENIKNDYLKILKTINLFISVLGSNNFRPADIDLHKNMYYLAESGYASKDIVQLLSGIMLPTIKSRLLSYAYAIKEKCSKGPVILGLSGDMLPIKIVCTHEECQHAGLHKTLLSKSVTVNADLIYDTHINRGIYFNCELLTNKLRSHLKTMT